mmetsp:Transcript_5114/g.7824  ORF Transcript_5114/g.7824 Transcript_5114/m.7824 type:complete len:235 (-) Transcript_5114:3085-3789(-)
MSTESVKLTDFSRDPSSLTTLPVPAKLSNLSRGPTLLSEPSFTNDSFGFSGDPSSARLLLSFSLRGVNSTDAAGEVCVTTSRGWSLGPLLLPPLPCITSIPAARLRCKARIAARAEVVPSGLSAELESLAAILALLCGLELSVCIDPLLLSDWPSKISESFSTAHEVSMSEVIGVGVARDGVPPEATGVEVSDGVPSEPISSGITCNDTVPLIAEEFEKCGVHIELSCPSPTSS